MSEQVVRQDLDLCLEEENEQGKLHLEESVVKAGQQKLSLVGERIDMKFFVCPQVR